MKVICNQANECSHRETCPGAKPHDYRNNMCGTPCGVDALADCVPVVEEGFSSEADMKQCSQSGMEDLSDG